MALPFRNRFQKSNLQAIFTTVLIVPFVSQIILAVSLVGWLSLRNGQRAVNNVADQLRQETIARINQNLVSYLDAAQQTTQANADAISSGLLSVENFEPWNSHLWRQTLRSPSLSLIGLGLETKGVIVTDRSGKDGKILIRVSEESNGYNLQGYALNPAGEREKIVATTKDYDPRTRSWYKGAAQARKPVWSPIFTQYLNNILSITRSYPVIDQQGRLQGVLLSTVLLDQVGDFLQNLKVGKTGQTFIMERSGFLVASSTKLPLTTDGDKPQRIKAIESSDRITQTTAQYLANKFGELQNITTPQQLDFSIQNEKQFLQVVPFQDSAGIDWLIVVVVPEADFMGEVNAIQRSTILLCLAAAIVATLIGLFTSQWLARPIIRLAVAARAVAEGSWDESLPIEREDELGILAEAFNRMVGKLQQSLTEVAQREAKLTEAQQVAHMGSWQFNFNTKETLWSEEMFRIYGLEPREIAPSYEEALQLIHPEDRSAIAHALEEVLATQQPFSLDYRIVGARETRYVNGKGQPIWDHQQVIGALGTVMDITDRKQAEIALRTSEAELRTQTEQLESLIVQLHKTQAQLVQTEKMSSLGQMVAGIAHEINNPVSFIYGNIGYAQEYTQDLLKLIQIVQENQQDLPPMVQEAATEVDIDFLAVDLPELLRSMKIGAERIQKIVISLRNFSRLDESAIKAVDIHEGIDSTLMILQHRLKEDTTHPEIIVVRNYGQLPLVECYAGQLNQVFMNLLANAIDALVSHFTKHGQEVERGAIEKPTIWISTEYIIPDETLNKTSEEIMIRVQDNAGGIPLEHQSKLFDPFFTTKPVGQGTGLGLAISYQVIVEKHGGRLEVNSQLNQGTEFTITIPVHQQK